MPLFQRNGQKLSVQRPINFSNEKEIQTLIQHNLETVFSCQLIATEFSTGVQHAGRIDTLALSEDGNPVIIEYKKVESSELINQSLYYLSWLNDHRGDFQVAVNKALCRSVDVDWSAIRVICLAPGYKKFDLHAVQMMGASIELWQYRLFENGGFYLEEVFRRSTSLLPSTDFDEGNKNPTMVAAGKKAAVTRATGVYSFDEHTKGLSDDLLKIVQDLRDFILGLDEAIEEAPKKFYVAYKATKNFACLEVQKSKLLLFLKLDPKQLVTMPKNARDVGNIGHYGTGDLELTIHTPDEAKAAQSLIKSSFEEVGG